MSASYHKTIRQRTFLSLERENYLSKHCRRQDPYRMINQIADFESYRKLAEDAIEKYRKDERTKKKAPPSNNTRGAGRKPADPVFMLRCCFLQRYLNLSDETFCERLLDDRYLQRFLDIEDLFYDCISRQTLWKYREIYSKYGVLESFFVSFSNKVKSLNSDIGKVVIVDSSFVEAPKQRNSREENEQIKQGSGATLWTDLPNKKRHKDVDASWTKKRNEVHYGYKAHHTVCGVSKLILQVFTTTAKVHDAKVFDQMLPKDGHAKMLFADAGYVGKEIQDMCLKANIHPLICEKGFKNKPLTEAQKEDNRLMSQIRCRIEHVFGFIQGSMRGSNVRSIGMNRAQANVFLTSLVYNVFRVRCLLERPRPQAP